jgi:uncharacterized delta-60 repeat protein
MGLSLSGSGLPRVVALTASTILVVASASLALVSTSAFASVTVDSSFSGNGYDRRPMGHNGWSSAATLGNRTVAVAPNHQKVVVVLFNRHGRLDQSFSGNGVRSFRGESPFGVDVQIDSQGRIVVFYRTLVGFEVVRLLPSGRLDKTFSRDGHLSYIVGDSSEVDYAIDSLDRIVIAKGHSKDVRMWRWTASGARDTSFSGDGKLIDDTRSGRYFGGIDTTSSNDIIVFHAGDVEDNGSVNLEITSYAADGASSATVETVTRKGMYPADVEVGQDDSVTAIAAGPEIGTRVLAVRLNPAGDLDPTFGGDGVISGPCPASCGVSDMALDSAGDIYLTGLSRSGPDRNTQTNTYVARVTSAGVWDESFASGGIRVLTLFDEPDFGETIALDTAGRLVVAGDVGNSQDAFLTRLVVAT